MIRRVLVLVALAGCAHRPVLVNDPDSKDLVDLGRQGLLCFRATATEDTDVIVEVDSEPDGETYRFALNPMQGAPLKVWLGPVVVHRGEGRSPEARLTLYQFPPGKYRLRYLRLGTGPSATRLKATKRLRPAVFEINAGEIVYAGDHEVQANWGLILPTIDVQTQTRDDYDRARAELEKTENHDIRNLKLRRAILRLDVD